MLDNAVCGLLADPHGDVAAVEIAGSGCELRRPADGLWVARGAGPGGPDPSGGGETLPKKLGGAAPLSPASLARVLVAEFGGCAVVDPHHRRLGLAFGGELDWVACIPGAATEAR